MDIPAVAPAQFANQIEADILPQPSAPLTWISFGGAPQESSADFVQSIQRIAFQQNRMRDDKWVAEYASTCFNGDALFWFLELGQEVQEGWKRLRLALARRFPPPKAAEANAISLPPAEPPVTAPVAMLTLNPPSKRGRIEVVGELASTLGYLAFDPSSGISITPSENKALLVILSDPVSSDPCHIQMVGLPGASAAFPYLGLALLKSPDQNADNSIPGKISMWNSNGVIYGVPIISEICKQGPFSPRVGGSRPRLATWTLSNCGRSRSSLALLRKSATPLPNSRATGAVWRYDGKNEDLSLTWLMDNREECELGAYVHQGSTDSLHVHRIDDVRAAGRCLVETKVDLVLKSI